MKLAFWLVIAVVALLFTFSVRTTHSQKTPIGVFDDHSDVGPVKNPGEVKYGHLREPLR